MVSPVSYRFGAPLWSPFSPLHFQFSSWFCWMDFSKLFWAVCIIALFGQLYYCRPPVFPSMLPELANCCGCVPLSWFAPPSREMCRAIPGAFHGIELDSVEQNAQLPVDRLQIFKGLITSWLPWKWCHGREHKSLIGLLHHGAEVVWLGRTFFVWSTCWHVFGRKITPSGLIMNFIRIFNGGSSFWLSGLVSASGSFQGCPPLWDLEVASNTAGLFGFGAFIHCLWFAGSWFKDHSPLPINNCSQWQWRHMFGGIGGVKRHVLFRSDNQAVVHILNTRTSKVPCIMHLLHDLLMSAAHHSFLFCANMCQVLIIELLMLFFLFN